MKKAILSFVLVGVLLGSGGVYYIGIHMPRVERERIARQVAFNQAAKPHLKEFARLADESVSLALTEESFHNRETSFHEVRTKAALIRESVQGLEAPNREMTHFVEYFSGLVKDLQDYAEAELFLIQEELANRAFEGKIVEFEDKARGFSSGDLLDLARHDVLKHRASQARAIYEERKIGLSRLAQEEIPQTALGLYWESSDFFEAYKGMLGDDQKSLWKKVTAAEKKGIF